jgi:transcriptional regulator with XRE-family HTH domain
VVKLNPRELRRQMGRRGLTAAELAALGHLSPATVRKALCGRPISPRSLRAIATALEESPACPDGFVAL